MEGLSGDIFATKGIEYLIVIGYLVVLIVFWRMLSQPRAGERSPLGERALRSGLGLFAVRDGVYYHQGHSWAAPEGRNVFRVGMDEFAMRLLGRPGAVELPAVGTKLSQGERGWSLAVGSKTIPVLSPVNGEIIAVNTDVRQAPDLLSNDPYEGGWLMKVKVNSGAAAHRNLLSGKLARAWMDSTLEKLRLTQAGELGFVMPDGGIPVDGFARALGGEDWDAVAREFLLVDDDERA
ncbi:MAG TPA: glycine cleavage system protein H [Gemmatimonadota bacterium]|nr:glycine cleavage system protein H [Gemmatimonadota bacterium]